MIYLSGLYACSAQGRRRCVNAEISQRSIPERLTKVAEWRTDSRHENHVCHQNLSRLFHFPSRRYRIWSSLQWRAGDELRASAILKSAQRLSFAHGVLLLVGNPLQFVYVVVCQFGNEPEWNLSAVVFCRFPDAQCIQWRDVEMPANLRPDLIEPA